MQWRAAARHVVRFDHRDRVAGVAPVDTNDHHEFYDGFAKDFPDIDVRREFDR